MPVDLTADPQLSKLTACSTPLAIHGGPKAKSTPYTKGNRFGEEEKRQVIEALEQQTLFFAHGKKTQLFRERFAARYGVKHCVPCTSGTAALHLAVAACGIRPGDEVITASITDMGTCSAILLCGAIPVFADLDPHNFLMDPSSVEARIGPKTTAIIAVHIAGAPCDMDALKAIADKHDLWLIEDCAQSYLTEYKRQLCGTIGDIGCFSLNDFKHISAGDAGMIITNDDALARHAELFADKCYDRRPGAERNPLFMAPNYRMCELQAAVALAQLEKLDSIIARRRHYGDRLDEGLRDLPGILPQQFVPGARSSYWFYPMRIDPEVLGPRAEFVKALNAEGVNGTDGLIIRVAYLWDVFTKKQGFGGTDFPFSLAPHIEYTAGLCPIAEEFVETNICFAVNEFFTDEDVEQTLEGVRKVVWHFSGR
jgi:dTDP-4-amino-4,6-dideoxygalactose transaminase